MNRDRIAEPRPAEGVVHVWWVRIDGRVAARTALAEILAAYLGGPETAEVLVKDGGKPRLAAAPERLSFNLSHSGGLALVAVAAGGASVGVDVERVKPRRDLPRLARRRLPAAEAEAVAAAPEADRERAFYAAWTRHEARVKCVGTGLAGPTPPASVVAWSLAIEDGYAAAVALALDGPDADPPEILVRTRDER